MEKNLYIDASHPNETRVVLKSNGNIEDYEYESVKNTLVKEGKAKAVKEISNKLDSIEQKADEVYEKVKKKKKDKKKKKNN